MSNHDGSYLLNETMQVLEKYKVVELLGREKMQQLVLDIVKLSDRYDCNPGEILKNVGERIGICYYCLEPATNFKDGLCPNCQNEWDDSEDEEEDTL